MTNFRIHVVLFFFCCLFLSGCSSNNKSDAEIEAENKLQTWAESRGMPYTIEKKLVDADEQRDSGQVLYLILVNYMEDYRAPNYPFFVVVNLDKYGDKWKGEVVHAQGNFFAVSFGSLVNGKCDTESGLKEGNICFTLGKDNYWKYDLEDVCFGASHDTDWSSSCINGKIDFEQPYQTIPFKWEELGDLDYIQLSSSTPDLVFYSSNMPRNVVYPPDP